jgi:hypothetical protein
MFVPVRGLVSELLPVGKKQKKQGTKEIFLNFHHLTGIQDLSKTYVHGVMTLNQGN